MAKDNNSKFTAARTDAGLFRSSLRATSKDYMESLTKIAGLKADLQQEMASSRDQDKITELTNQLGALEVQKESFKSKLTDLEASLSGKIDDLLVELDPRMQVENLDDQYPVLLLPVRVETRFMTVKHIARVKNETLPDNFISNIDQLSIDQRRLPVSDLYSTYTEIPVIEDLEELWIRIFPDDIAIHTHEEGLTPLEIDAGEVFWTNMWYAGGDSALEIGAWRGLVSGRSPERAAWISKEIKPTNDGNRPSSPTDPNTPLPTAPIFPSPSQKPDSWTQTPHSRVMPDRFVVRLYIGTDQREIIGKRIPDPLPVSFDPIDPVTGLDNTGGKLVLPEKIRWVQDFDEAEKVGMAIRVPLLKKEMKGFSRMLVLGVKASADEGEAKTLVEELIDNHHYTSGGFSIVPQGTPTNNTEDGGSGYSADNSGDEELFDLEVGNGQFSEENNDRAKTDGQHLAEALGIDFGTLKHIKDAGMTDIKEAMCMNRALWPTTLGYYLKQIMHPIFSDSDVKSTQSHFNQFVLGRGRIPAIRVDDQPYGILTTTAFSKWNYKDTDSKSIFLSKMKENVLTKMEDTWQQLSGLVKHADQTFSAADTDKAFLEILGLHASSVEFYQRYVSGPFFIWNIYAYSTLLQNQTVPPNLKTASYATSLDFLSLFQNLNYIFAYPPRVFDFIHARTEKYLDGPVVDPFPLSEIRTLKELGSNGENYINWLKQSNYYAIQAENFSNIGADGAIPPNSLLYLMLRHSCLLEYVHTGINVLISNGILTSDAHLDTELANISNLSSLSPAVTNLVQARVMLKEGAELDADLSAKADAEFSKRAEEGALEGFNFKEIEASKKEFKQGLKAEVEPAFQAKVNQIIETEIQGLKLTASKTAVLGETFDFLKDANNLASWIDSGILLQDIDPELAQMADLKSALGCLADVPTARLERLFAEHVDLASYRLDAWFTSLVSQRLDKLRNQGSSRQTGLYLGAYSWLENVRPGTFPGIVYREVKIEEDKIIIPGIKDILVKDIPLPGPIETEPLPGLSNLGLKDVQIGGSLGTFAAKPSSSEDKTDLDTPLAEKSITSKENELALASTLMESGGASFILDTSVNELLIDYPLVAKIPGPISIAPKFTYLGTGDKGEVMYDPILDKFVHKPRSNSKNQGYIHAPSINQAMTAAVLRAGYESHKTNPGSPDDTFAINLSSERVRRAMFYMEGIRNGQELAALLGYQFERALHDRNANLDAYILDIRLKYPLVAGRVTDTSGATTINDAESYNVVDGLKLMEAYRENSGSWFTGITFSSGQDKTNIEEEIERLADSMDAIHDLLLAESVHQVVQGNTARSRAALNAISGSGIPPEPELIKTPRGFDAITLRKAIIFDQSAGGAVQWTAAGSPRSIAEPGINSLLADMLPSPDKIGISVAYRMLFADGSPGSEEIEKMMVDMLDLEAIDFYSLLAGGKDEGQSAEFDQRLVLALQNSHPEIAIEVIEIRYTDKTGFLGDERTIQELGPLLKSLRSLVRDSKKMDPRDFLLPGEAETTMAANPTAGFDPSELENRLSDVLAVSMANGNVGMEGIGITLDASIALVSGSLTGGMLGFDQALSDQLSNDILAASFFGIQGSIPAISGNQTEDSVNDLLEQAGRVSSLVATQLGKAQALLAEVAPLTEAGAKIAKLEEVAQAIFGRAFKVIPRFKIYDVATLNMAKNYPDYLLAAGNMAIDEWIQGLAPVRKRMQNFQKLSLLTQALKGAPSPLSPSIVQLPLAPLDGGGNVQARWLGMKLPPDYEIPEENLSMVIAFPAGYDSSLLQAGLIVDEWIEEIPIKDAHTGLSVHYDNPNSEPPNACLLAVSPDLNGKWEWDDLMDTLYETLDWAKKRAVDPDLLNNTPYAQLLPGIMAAIAGTDTTPTLDFGRNVVEKPRPGVFDLIKLKEFIKISGDFLNLP